MEKCVYCGTETLLYVNERPVCVECSDDMESAAEKHQSPLTMERLQEVAKQFGINPDLPRAELIDAIAEAAIKALNERGRKSE